MSNTLYALDESRLRLLIAVGPNPQQVNEFKEEHHVTTRVLFYYGMGGVATIVSGKH